ncbi:MAG TPA: dienelactone hydrolase family protein [Gemmatimonadaceae bacterium]|nr:dienelactone hydrolase family protein [Gemmatimonadaceae bacterium]
MTRAVIALCCSMVVTACGGGTSTTGAGDTTTFAIQGDATSPNGATWIYRDVVDGTRYDLAGVLYKPSGAGPFPAVILSHGSEGSASFFASLVAPTFVQWGLVCIATNYTHSTGVPIGAPGDASQPGASPANVLRAHMTYALLGRLGYVDMSRVALHGHSMGAYVNTALAGAYPSGFRVASQTGGGVRPDFIVAGPAPSPTQAVGIRIPFQMHHGELDTTVPLSYDQRFDSLLTATGVEHQLYTYPGEDHLQVRTDQTMFARVHAWYTAHGMF